MKKLLLLFCAAFAFSAADAQYYLVPHQNAHTNPGPLNNDGEYPIGTAGAQTGWTVIHDATSGSIVWTPVINLPGSFNFKFNNAPVTAYKASTSGVVTFTTTATAVPASTNTALPAANIPDKSLLTWGMTPQAADKIAYKIFGASPNRQYWIQYNSYTTPGTDPTGWTYWSIVLEETTNKIYFVDQKTANGTIGLTVGIQVDGTTALQLPASPAVTSLAGNGGTPADNSYYEFIYGVQPNHDIEMKLISTAGQLPLSKGPFQLKGDLKNAGAQPITSFDLTYKIDNNAPVTTPVTGVNIAPQSMYTFTHPTAWSPAANGFYQVKMWTSNVNGNPDQVPANDTTEKIIEIKQTPRTVIYEVFTSATCPPCLPGNSILHAVTDANPGESINIKYQQNFPAPGDDPYQTTESIARRTFYGITSIPHMKPDGGINFASSWSPAAWNANYYNQTLHDMYAGVPANVLVDGVYYINPADSMVTATATITPFANVNSNNLVLHSVITERTTVNNFRTNGETVFHDVMKKMMPNVNGLPIPALVNGQEVNYTQSFKMSEANYTDVYTKFAAKPNRIEDINNLRVVFFVQDKVTKEVFNAGMGVKVSQPLGIAKNADAVNLTVFPNPTDGMVNIAFTPEAGKPATATVYNLLGGVVYTKAVKSADTGLMNIDLAGNAKGVYLLKLQVGEKIVTRKISLTK